MSKIKYVLPSIIECNLHSPELSSSPDERQKIFDLYINCEDSVYHDSEFLSSSSYRYFVLYIERILQQGSRFFMDSDKIIASKIEEMKAKEDPSYICLALLLVAGAFDIKYTSFECVIYGKYYTFLHDVISESSFKNAPKSRKNKNQSYRKAFIEYLTVHLTESDVYAFKLPLLNSCTLGYDEFVSYFARTWNSLLENQTYEQSMLFTPLYEACTRGHLNIVKILVESNKYQDIRGISDNPISCACEKGYTDIVELLLTHSVCYGSQERLIRLQILYLINKPPERVKN
ncbi:unnamed protein product [Mytilus edulis]|uniref:Uncharacterized protein n=1 Tax=Mytilus edulis TaxID=6550 RepID=A0A8S3QZC9_MYTED|nr:unnamed protein product [Mytilus edulis]